MIQTQIHNSFQKEKNPIQNYEKENQYRLERLKKKLSNKKQLISIFLKGFTIF